ncbi:MAG: transposase, partial [Methylomicrobium sp.]|nr:transposase [Methylomicrobium sp.]
EIGRTPFQLSRKILARLAITHWAQDDLSSGCIVLSNGLPCFARVTDADCQHQVIIAGGRKPKDLPEFCWINTVLGNLKTSLGGAYHAFDFAKYGTRNDGAFAYRFNRRFRLDTITTRLIVAAATTGPRSDTWLWQAEASCQSGKFLSK